MLMDFYITKELELTYPRGILIEKIKEHRGEIIKRSLGNDLMVFHLEHVNQCIYTFHFQREFKPGWKGENQKLFNSSAVVWMLNKVEMVNTHGEFESLDKEPNGFIEWSTVNRSNVFCESKYYYNGYLIGL